MTVFLLSLCLASCLIGFWAAKRDKSAAQRRARRTPERVFTAVALLGGGIGVLAGFYLFRHKTKHTTLLLKVWGGTVISTLAVCFCLYRLYI